MVVMIVWIKYWWTTDLRTHDILSSDYFSAHGGIKQSSQWATLLVVLEKVDTLSLKM